MFWNMIQLSTSLLVDLRGTTSETRACLSLYAGDEAVHALEIADAALDNKMFSYCDKVCECEPLRRLQHVSRGLVLSLVLSCSRCCSVMRTSTTSGLSSSSSPKCLAISHRARISSQYKKRYREDCSMTKASPKVTTAADGRSIHTTKSVTLDELCNQLVRRSEERNSGDDEMQVLEQQLARLERLKKELLKKERPAKVY